MSIFENTRKAFGAGGDYDDESYEDYGREKRGFKAFFSDFFGFEKDEEPADEDYESRNAKSERRESRGDERASRRYGGTRGGGFGGADSSDMNENSAGTEIITLYPQTVDDATRIIQEVKRHKIVIFDVNDQIESSDDARRIVDFVGGAAEGLECPFSRLCASIFCIAPAGVRFTNTKTKYTR